MTKKTQSTNKTEAYSLGEYMAKKNLSTDLFSKISEDIRTRDILSSVLICVEDKTVVRLTTTTVISGSEDKDAMVNVLSYTDWRDSESDLLSNDYDIRRFTRSTKIETLCNKVREHSQYSFIAKVKAEEGADRVIKYTFVRLTPDAKYILGTRQEITKSLEHDIVTGGLNREGLLRELDAKIKNANKLGNKLTVLCFNIKNFRAVNELYGTAIGDKVLQHMYTAIVYSELHPISYARYESDNFICLINRDTLDTDVITRLCYQEYIEEDKKIVFRSSCGIYNIEKQDVAPVSVCDHAKLAISFIKDQFITPWMVYDHKMQKTVISDTEVLSQLDEAMARKEFIPYYQPVVNIQNGKIEMAEALVRWKSEKHGMISPALFIPVLERHGGLSRIDQMMEDRVFALQQQRLRDGRPVVPIDLNLSWVDFADTKLVNQLQDHILDDSVPTDLVRFEITESAYEEIAENRVDVLSFFQQNDVKLLVDDFGQGYSFGTMKNVDFHIIKLDKSLIDKIGKSRKMDMLVETLITVFHNLNAKVVAEGVEDEKQVEFLKKAGCDYIQGFYFYRPMDEESFLSLLEKQSEEEKTQQMADGPVVVGADEETAALWVERDVLEKQYVKMQKSVEELKCLQMLLDEMDVHLFEWDVKTHEDLASEKFVKMYGLPSNIIPNMPEECPIVIEEDRDRFRDFYGRIARGEKMGSDRFRLYTPDGKGYTWYQKTFYTLYDNRNMPYKAIITMRDSQEEYRYRMLRARDRMLTKQQEIVTFIYTLNNDTISLNFRTKDGDVASAQVENFLVQPENLLSPDQQIIANNLCRIIAERSRNGYFDFEFLPLKAEYRAHYTIVDGDYGSIYAVIGQAEDINKTRERLEAKEQMLRMSRYDGLTQLFNRSIGEKEMEKLLKSGQPGLFGILDCDRFKSVNDSFGHAVGDSLLVAIAKTLQKYNPDGINMRLGGDEFAFFVTDTLQVKSFKESVSQFFQEISSLQVPGIVDFLISVSVGAVYYNGQEDVDFDSLYRKADMLLYKSKEYLGNKLTM